MSAIRGRFLFVLCALFLWSGASLALPTVNSTLVRTSNTTLALSFSGDPGTTTNTDYTLGGSSGFTGNPTAVALDGTKTVATLTVPTMASLAHGKTVTVTVATSVADASSNVATYTVDTVPAAFSFPEIVNATTATAYESAPATISGITAPVPVSLTAGSSSTLTCSTLASDATTWSAFGACASVTVNDGDQIKLKLTAASTAVTTVSGGISVGGVSATFSVTTAAPVSMPTNVSHTPLTSLTAAIASPPGQLYISSNGIVVVPATTAGTIALLYTAPADTAFLLQNGATATFTIGGENLSVQAVGSDGVLAVLKYFVLDDYANLPVLEIARGRAVVSGSRDVAPLASVQLGTGSSTVQVVLLATGTAFPITADIKLNSDGTGMAAVTHGVMALRKASAASTVKLTDGATALYAAEVANLSGVGLLTGIRVGSLDGNGTGVGDAMTFPSGSIISTDIERRVKIPILEAPLQRISGPNGTETLLEALFDGIGLRGNLIRGGQTTQGVIPLLIDGVNFYFVPVGDVTVDASRADGVVLTSDGFFEVTRRGVTARIRSSLFDTRGFATHMGITMNAAVRMTASGALEILQNGITLLAMPEMHTIHDGSANGVGYDGEGYLNYTASGERQRLLPYFIDIRQLTTTFASLADSITVQDNLDGTVSTFLTDAASGQTTELLLVPEYRVLSPLEIPIAHRGDAWWVGDDGALYLKYSNGSAQGFRVR